MVEHCIVQNVRNFSTKSGDDLNYHIAKQHSAAGPSISYKCKQCHAEFPGFYALRQHKNTQHGTQIGLGAREELHSCRHSLVNSEI